MKFKLGYFYQVRFFTPNMIPISTAHSDPAWYHQGCGPQFTFLDKNQVINGLRCQELAPGYMCEGLCNGKHDKGCLPDSCDFLKVYRMQLETTFNIENFLTRCQIAAKKTQELNKYTNEPIIVLLVHEAPNNPCSERKPLLDFFNSHGVQMEELQTIDLKTKI